MNLMMDKCQSISLKVPKFSIKFISARACEIQWLEQKSGVELNSEIWLNHDLIILFLYILHTTTIYVTKATVTKVVQYL